MKHKAIYITALIFFLVFNTAYFWENFTGIWHLPIILILLSTFIFLLVVFFKHLILTIKEKFKAKSRLKVLTTLFIILGLTIYKPYGIINFAYFESETLFSSQIEGAANCMTYFELKKNGSFVEKSFCFGPSEINGKYKLKGDTIFFYESKENRTSSKYYEFALLKKNSQNSSCEISFFENEKDTNGLPMQITFNQLK